MANSILVFVEQLSEREIEVLEHIAGGQTGPEIAVELVISPKTVRSHVVNILGKLGVHNRMQAVVMGQRLGLIDRESTLSPIATVIAALIVAYPEDYAQVKMAGIGEQP